MKHIVLVACLLATAAAYGHDSADSSQKSRRHLVLRCGPEFGVNVSDYLVSSNVSPSGYSVKSGIRGGLTGEAGFTGNLYVQASLLYLMNGYNPPQSAGGGETSMNISTIELPVMITYKPGRPHTNRPFCTFGPYVAMNMGGSVTTTGGTAYPVPVETTTTRALRIGSNGDDDIRRLDYGACLNFGFELVNGIGVRLIYQQGLANLLPASTNGDTMKNFNFGFTAQYMFKCKRQ